TAFESSCRMPPNERQNAWRRSGDWPERTFLDDFFEQVRKDPRRAALVCYRKGLERPETVTYGQLGAMVDRMAMALIDLGVERDDVVSIQLPNGWQFAVAAFAAARAGAVVNPLVTIFRRRELEFMLGRAGSKVLIVADVFRGFQHASLGMELKSALPSLEHVIVSSDLPGAAPAGAMSLERDFLGHAWGRMPGRESTLAARRRGGDEIASLMYTSGTTGEPKGTLHAASTLWSSSRGVFEGLGLGAQDVGFMASPMGHLTGYLWGLLQPLSMGMTMIFQDSWDPARFLDVVAEERISWTIGATPFVVDSVAEQQRTPRAFDSLRLFVCAGAPIPPTLSRAAHEVLGAKLIGQWGTSECGGVTIHRPDDSIEAVAASDGHVLPFMELKLLDEQGREVERGLEGQLFARGPSVFVGYIGRRDLYDAVVDAEGWFDTGDLGVQRPDGSIRIRGRAKDIIVRGGENVPVVEVENLLLEHPKVDRVAVIGVPDFRLGERGCAVIVPRDADAPTLAELTSFLEARGMAKQYWPELLVVRDSLPYTPTGKIQKFLLRDELASLGDAAAQAAP
ncbi:MAG TPA: AMP-binding protein, partial [Ramlibacter sp.]|nr:AMP-binding protein [Ramlibacter sp.]